jgi:photosystem II stability/assembly factor-like uncharacterized protein
MRRPLRQRLICCAFIVSGFAGSVACNAGNNTWTVTGPAGEDVGAVAFEPATAGTIFATTPVGGLYRSADGGQSWTSLSLTLQSGLPGVPAAGVSSLLVDPAAPQHVFVFGNDTLYRSDDGGQTFSDFNGPSGQIAIGVPAMAADGSVLYIGSLSGIVYSSTDLGVTWTQLANGLPGQQYVADVEVDPQTPATVYATIYQNGLYKSTNGGQNWSGLGPGGAGAFANSTVGRLAIDPTNSSRLLLATSAGVELSSDGGKTWTLTQTNSTDWVGFDPSAPGSAIALGHQGPIEHSADHGSTWTAGALLGVEATNGAAFDSLNAGHLLIATSDGPYLTTDSGATITLQANGIQGVTISAFSAANDGSGAVYAALARPGSVGPQGVYLRSSTGWVPVNNAALHAAAVPMGVQNIVSLAVNPTNHNNLYVAQTNGLFVTSDGGTTWAKADPQFDNNVLESVAFAASNPSIVDVSTQAEGIIQTTNGGMSWSALAGGLPASIGALAIDPTNAAKMYAASIAPAALDLFGSSDGGVSWKLDDTGLAGQSIQSLTIDPTNTAVLYAATYSGLFKSSNSGGSWSILGDPTAQLTLLVDPQVPTDLVLVSLPNGGVSRSVDGGLTWEALPQVGAAGSTQNLNTAILDPLQPGLVIAGVADLGIVELQVAPDLNVTLQGAPAQFTSGTSSTVVFTTANAGPYAASVVSLTITIPTALSVTTTPTGCTLSSSTLSCNLGVLRANQNVQTSVTFGVLTPGSTGTLTAAVAAHEPDANMANNSVSQTVTTSAPQSTGGGSKGGGGALEWLTLAALLPFVGFHVRRRCALRSGRLGF